MIMRNANLNRECRVFCRYLLDQEPTAYLLDKYREGHDKHPLEQEAQADRFEGLLVRVAGQGPFFTRLADSYARFFLPRAVLRKKLILLLALAESCAPTHQVFDAVEPGGKAVLFGKMLGRGVLFAATLTCAAAVFLPLQVVGRSARLRRSASGAARAGVEAEGMRADAGVLEHG